MVKIFGWLVENNGNGCVFDIACIIFVADASGIDVLKRLIIEVICFNHDRNIKVRAMFASIVEKFKLAELQLQRI